MITTAPGTRAESFGPVEWVLVATIAGVWGSSFLLIAIGLEAFRPGLVTLLHIAVGAGVLSLFPGARRRVEREDLSRIALLGAVWMAIPLTLIAVAQQWVPSSTAGMINGAGPLFAALIAVFLLRRFPGPLQAIGLIIGFVGVVIVSLVVAEGGSSTILGVLLLLLGTVLFGLSANIAVPLQQRYGALPIVWRAQLAAAFLILPYGLISISDSNFDAASLWAVLVLGVGATGLGFVLMAILVGRAGATRGAVVIYFLPAVATLLGVVFRGESVGAVATLGLALIVAGAYLTSRREAPPPPRTAKAQTPRHKLGGEADRGLSGCHARALDRPLGPREGGGMIARTWRGWTKTEDADAYVHYLVGTGMKEYRETPGNRAVYLLRRAEGGRTEFVTLTFWDSMDAVKGFAGEEVERAVFYPEDDRFLVDRETIALHYEVVE